MDDLDVNEYEINGVKISLKPGDGGACVVSADLGPLAEDDADALIVEMLEANYAFQGTAGATLAIDPDTGHAVLRKREWPGESDDEWPLKLSVFVDKAREWHDRLREPPVPDACNLFREIV